MNPALQQFQWTVQALAACPEDQLRLCPDFVQKADELALDFDNWRQVVEPDSRGWSSEQRRSVENLDRMLSEMSGQANALLWQDEAVRFDPHWQALRRAAQEILDALGWPAVVPPGDRAIYVKGTAP